MRYRAKEKEREREWERKGKRETEIEVQKPSKRIARWKKIDQRYVMMACRCRGIMGRFWNGMRGVLVCVSMCRFYKNWSIAMCCFIIVTTSSVAFHDHTAMAMPIVRTDHVNEALKCKKLNKNRERNMKKNAVSLVMFEMYFHILLCVAQSTAFARSSDHRHRSQHHKAIGILWTPQRPFNHFSHCS